jgi:hypothetical protein
MTQRPAAIVLTATAQAQYVAVVTIAKFLLLVQPAIPLLFIAMKTILASFTLVVCAFSALAAEPTDASVEKLLVLTKAESMMDAVYGSFEQNMRQGMKQATAEKKLTDEQLRVLENAQKKNLESMRKELTWSNFKPMFVQIYKETYDQEEIDGLNTFFSTKAGQTYINKMPVAMQKSMAVVRQRMGPMMSKIGEALKAALAEAKVGK